MYAGPDSRNAAARSICTDPLGKSSVASLSLLYDATPPAPVVIVAPGDGLVGLRWRADDVASLASLEITRTPGLGNAAASVVYHGRSGAYQDKHVRNGVRYRYTVTAYDGAGNVTVRSLMVTPGPRLVAPSPNARMSEPPLLRWTPIRKASYYNVQIYRGRKVLSVWPSGASVQLTRSWSFEGQRFRLKPGRYRWYVWPGFGPRSAAHYGAVIGSRTFVVT